MIVFASFFPKEEDNVEIHLPVDGLPWCRVLLLHFLILCQQSSRLRLTLFISILIDASVIVITPKQHTAQSSKIGTAFLSLLMTSKHDKTEIQSDAKESGRLQ